MKTAILALILIYMLGETVRAESTVPSQLVIGYDDEGKVDPCPRACFAHVQGITTSDKAELERAAKDIYALRASVTQIPTPHCRVTIRPLSKRFLKIGG